MKNVKEKLAAILRCGFLSIVAAGAGGRLWLPSAYPLCQNA